MEIQYSSAENGNGEEGVYVFGNTYDPPVSVSISSFVEISSADDDNSLAIAECREGLIVDRATKGFTVASLSSENVIDVECCQLYKSIPLGNQGVGVVERYLTFNAHFESTTFTSSTDNVTFAATCASIVEYVIESCVWHDAGVMYFGDWNVGCPGQYRDDDGD